MRFYEKEKRTVSLAYGGSEFAVEMANDPCNGRKRNGRKRAARPDKTAISWSLL
jgi:hypothetical protein